MKELLTVLGLIAFLACLSGFIDSVTGSFFINWLAAAIVVVYVATKFVRLRPREGENYHQVKKRNAQETK